MRKARLIQEGATYHVTAKTNRGEFLLHTDEIKNMLLGIIQDAKKKFNFKVKHFCIMNNHIHLLIQPGKGAGLSHIMQWILSVFAIRFNKYFGLIGHVWYDRFKSKIIMSFRQLINTFHYISDNPVKAGMCNKRTDYFWGGLYEIQNRRYRLMEPPDTWLKILI